MRVCLWIVLVAAGCATAAPTSPNAPAPQTAPTSVGPAPTPGACSIQTENFTGVTTTQFTYEGGRRTRSLQQGPAGTVQTLWSYDATGRRDKQVVIEGEDIRTHTFVYADGVLVREDVHDAGGTLLERHVRAYEGGRLTQRSLARPVEGELVVVDRHALHYDDAGRFVYELRTLTPTDEPPQVHSITVEVDSQGRVIARRTDEGMDGSPDRVSLFAFDGDGRLATVTQMKGESIDTVARHTYDDQGRMVRTELEDGAGKSVGTTTYDFSCWS